MTGHKKLLNMVTGASNKFIYTLKQYRTDSLSEAFNLVITTPLIEESVFPSYLEYGQYYCKHTTLIYVNENTGITNGS